MERKAPGAEAKAGFLVQVRNLFPLLAAVLTLASLKLPFWQLVMLAPQYPDEPLVIRLFVNKMSGDIFEFNTLNQYVGISFPSKIPEFHVFPYVLAALALSGLLAGVFSGRLKAWLLGGSLALYIAFLAGASVDLQYRLYLVGHDRNPNAPLVGIKSFTPPIVGPHHVAQMYTFSMFTWGALLVGLALALTILAFKHRHSERAWNALWRRNRIEPPPLPRAGNMGG